MAFTMYDRLQIILLDAEEPLQSSDISDMLQITRRDVMTRATDLYRQGRVSRHLVPHASPAGRQEVFVYYMTDAQKDAFRILLKKKQAHAARQAQAPQPMTPSERRQHKATHPRALELPEDVLAGITRNSMHCTQRLKFLYHLRDKTCFYEWQLLHEIIKDYEFALKKLTR